MNLQSQTVMIMGARLVLVDRQADTLAVAVDLPDKEQSHAAIPVMGRA